MGRYIDFLNLDLKAGQSDSHNIILLQIKLPRSIITDSAKNLNNDMINALCAKFKIFHYKPYRPKVNETSKLPIITSKIFIKDDSDL